jgi:hypothetical protein
MPFEAPSVGDTVQYHQAAGIGTEPFEAPATVTAVNDGRIDLAGDGFEASGVQYVDAVDGGSSAAYAYWYRDEGIGDPEPIGGLGGGGIGR